MASLTQDEAIRRGGQKLGIDPRFMSQVWPVARLDRPESDYYLTEFHTGKDEKVIAVLDAATGSPIHSARLPAGAHSTITMGADDAKAHSDAGEDAIARLVWKPCNVSHSPLYPIWQVRQGTRVVYVDQGGRIWHELATKARSG